MNTSPNTQPAAPARAEQAHTPTPWAVWRLAPDSDPQERCIITSADGETEISGIFEKAADAGLAVRAVNSHADLLEFLRDGSLQLARLTGPSLEAYARTFAALVEHNLAKDGRQ